MKANDDIRQTIKRSGLRNYMVADALGIQESYFSKILRYELSDEKKHDVMNAIEKLRGEQTSAIR